MSWKNLKVKTRIIALVLVLCGSMLLVGIVGLFNMRLLSVGLREANDSLHHVAVLSQIENKFLTMRLNLVYMLAITDKAAAENKAEDATKQYEAIKEMLAGLGKSNLAGEELELCNKIKEGVDAYFTQGKKLVELAKKAVASGNGGDHAEAVTFATTTVAPLFVKPAEAIDKLIELNEKEGRDMYKEDMAAYHKAFGEMLGIILVAAVLSVVFGLLVSGSITKPLNKVVDMLRDIAQGEGDLTKRLDASAKDEIGELCTWFNTFIDKLHGIISKISTTSTQVAAASTQLQANAAQIATGAEEVASQASTVATAGEEMSATSGDIARNCQMAAEGAQRASNSALKGAGVVENTVAVMGEIASKVQETAKTVESLGDRSDQIGNIIGTIEDIADQTNLLALNAAIEAARAGEQGRGFAVVADEVRALAERTTKATREIGEMIKAIQVETKGAVVAMEQGVQQVETGTEEAAKSGAALQEILEQVNAVAMQINQVATAAEEQTATTSEISTNMQQITQVVHQTSQGAQESATAAAQLSGNAEEMHRLVRQFKL